MRLLAEHLRLERGGRLLVDDLSFSAKGGKALLVKGANGSGKTTLLRTLAGFLRPTSGQITASGLDDDQPIGPQCHYVGHLNAVKATLSVVENAAFYSGFLNRSDVDDMTRMKASLERLRLWHIRDVPAGYLSAGQKRRLGLTRLLCAHRPIWLLDEPTTSLDQKSSSIVTEMMKKHAAAGGIVIAATHVDLGFEAARDLVLDSKAGPA